MKKLLLDGEPLKGRKHLELELTKNGCKLSEVEIDRTRN